MASECLFFARCLPLVLDGWFDLVSANSLMAAFLTDGCRPCQLVRGSPGLLECLAAYLPRPGQLSCFRGELLSLVCVLALYVVCFYLRCLDSCFHFWLWCLLLVIFFPLSGLFFAGPLPCLFSFLLMPISEICFISFLISAIRPRHGCSLHRPMGCSFTFPFARLPFPLRLSA